jgi:hypothetical protein
MEKVMEYVSKYGVLLLPILGFLIGKYLPTAQFNSLGKKVHDKIPESVAKLIAERLDAFEQGLLDQDFRGDKTLIGNSQLTNGVKSLKTDLGLEK